jgi:hypothetical protein
MAPAPLTDAAGHIEFETREGLAYGVSELFPLGGDGDAPSVACLVIQPESGAAPTRVRFDSPAADKLRKRYPELANIKAPAKDAAQQAKAADAAGALSDAEFEAEYQRRQAAKRDQTIKPIPADVRDAVAARNAAQLALYTAEAEVPRDDAKVARLTAERNAAEAAV